MVVWWDGLWLWVSHRCIGDLMPTVCPLEIHREISAVERGEQKTSGGENTFNQMPEVDGTDLTFDPTADSHSTLLQKNRTHPHIRPYPNKNTQPFQEKNNISRFTFDPTPLYPASNQTSVNQPPLNNHIHWYQINQPPLNNYIDCYQINQSPLNNDIHWYQINQPPLNNYIHWYEINQPPLHNYIQQLHSLLSNQPAPLEQLHSLVSKQPAPLHQLHSLVWNQPAPLEQLHSLVSSSWSSSSPPSSSSSPSWSSIVIIITTTIINHHHHHDHHHLRDRLFAAKNATFSHSTLPQNGGRVICETIGVGSNARRVPGTLKLENNASRSKDVCMARRLQRPLVRSRNSEVARS